jgi:uncharacterized protein YpmB
MRGDEMVRNKSTAVFAVLAAIVLGSIVFYFFIHDELKNQAKQEAISLILDLNEMDASVLTVKSADLAPEQRSYAVAVTNKEDDKTYQVAVILNEEQSEVNFAIDVTDTYDKYGLAYCH